MVRNYYEREGQQVMFSAGTPLGLIWTGLQDLNQHKQLVIFTILSTFFLSFDCLILISVQRSKIYNMPYLRGRHLEALASSFVRMGSAKRMTRI